MNNDIQAEKERKELIALFDKGINSGKLDKKATKKILKETYRLKNDIGMEERCLEAEAAEREAEDRQQHRSDMRTLTNEYN